MQFRKLSSQIALGLSAILVVVGAAAALDLLPWWADDELVATLICATVIAWLAFATSFLLERPLWRGAAIGFLAWLPFSCLAIALEVWSLGPWQYSAMAFALSLLTGPVFVGGSALRRIASWRLGATTILAGAVSAHLVQWATMIGQPAGFRGSQPFLSDPMWASISVGSLIVLVGLSMPGWSAPSRVHRVVSKAGFVLALATLLLVTFLIGNPHRWKQIGTSGLLFLSWGLAIVLCGWPAIIALPLEGWQRWLRWSASIGLVIFAIGVVGGEDWQAVTRITLPFGSIVLFGSLLGAGALQLVRRSSITFAKPEDVAALETTCPRCRSATRVPLGPSACGVCGLRFRLDVEEPRCLGCGYWLRAIQSDTCPECGRSVREPASPPSPASA